MSVTVKAVYRYSMKPLMDCWMVYDSKWYEHGVITINISRKSEKGYPSETQNTCKVGKQQTRFD